MLAAFAINFSRPIHFLIDTGASISILPPKYCSREIISPTAMELVTVDGRPLDIAGECSVSLSNKVLRREFVVDFVIANVSQPILGIDFLTKYNIIVNCKHCSITDGNTGISASCQPAQRSLPISLSLEGIPHAIRSLIQQFPDIIRPIQFPLKVSQPNVSHHIDTTSNRPIHFKPRQLPPEKLDAAKREFSKMMKAGIIRPSSSEWASPLHLVKKPDNTWRPCGDYRALNSITVPDRYPIPHIHHTGRNLFNCSVFSKIDLVKAYYQIPMCKEDISKTAVTTPFGLFEFIQMPFGLRNASQTFQRFMDHLFRDLKFVTVYIDDILVSSSTHSDHIQHLTEVLRRLSHSGLRISLGKCVFLATSVEFLGCTISKSGIEPQKSKVEAISEYPTPKDYPSARRFVGMAGFYRRFVPKFSDIVNPLLSCLTHYNKTQKQFTLSKEAEEAVKSIKQALVEATTLSHRCPTSHSFQLVTDASNSAVGAALHQLCDGTYKPIGFYSKKLSGAQRSYSAFDKELLAAYQSILNFKSIIDGQHTTLFTDHKPLVSAFHSRKGAKSDRQQRHLGVLTEFLVDAVHIRGNDNVVADALSRSISAVQADVLDLEALAEAQKDDVEVASFRDKLKSFSLQRGTLWCNVDTTHPRPFVPQPLRQRIFNKLHGLSHPGSKASVRLVRERYVWPSMERDIREWCRCCANCQSSKVTRHVKTPISFQIPVSGRFEAVHLDIVGPLPATQLSNGTTAAARYLLTMIDRASRWMEASPMGDISAETVATTFMETWISRFGVPLYVITDRGTQFEAELFSQLSAVVGFHRLRSAAYHPQTNGMVERLHRTLKSSIIARGSQWLRDLPIVLLGMRCLPNENGIAPFTAVTGQSLLAPRVLVNNTKLATNIDFVQQLARCMRQVDFATLSHGIIHSDDKQFIPKDLIKSKFVWVRVDRIRKPLEAPYSGPYRVRNFAEKTVTIVKEDGTTDTVSLNRIKPAYGIETQPTRVKIKMAPEQSKQQDSPQPAKSTRTGRRVHFPSHLHDYVP